jgi:hypothetical protein
VTALRRLVRFHPALAGWLVLAVLASRLLVPGGYMPVVSDDGIRIMICPGVVPAAAPMTMAAPGAKTMAMHGMDHSRHGGDQTPRTEMPCAFAGFGMPAMSGADPVLLVVALVFATAIVRHLREHLPPRAAPRLRPPTRGPPLTV